jgi:hypothetical protein
MTSTLLICRRNKSYIISFDIVPYWILNDVEGGACEKEVVVLRSNHLTSLS